MALPSNMRIAITGASGLLGANLAEVAVAAGHEVVCTHRSSSNIAHLAHLDLQWRLAPLEDERALTAAFEGVDIAFHCAARTSMLPTATPALVEANVAGTERIVRAVQAAGVSRLLHTSSTVAVGVSSSDTPCTEVSPWNLAERGLDDGYAITKRASEQVVLDAVAHQDLDAVVVNPGFLFGPLDARPSSGTMILEVASGRARAHTPGRNSFVDVRRVAQGMLQAAELGQAGERYILAGENLTYGEIFTRIAAIVGRPPPRISVPRWAAAPVGWGGDLLQWWTGREQPITSTTLGWGFERGFIMDSRKAIDELGYEPGSVDDGIRAAWAWFQQTGRA